jgi:radical SAM protein with 4Fe4S-binding SPASM domain
MEKPKGFIDDEFYSRIIREAFDEGTREVGLFINGEPFTNPNLSKYISLAKQIGYEYVYVDTNGSLVTPERLHEVINAGLDSIKFSINAATKENYAKVHKRDDFEKVINNVEYTKKYREICKKKYNIFGSFAVTDITVSETELFKEKYAILFDDFAFYKVRARWGGLMQENAKHTDFTKRKRCSTPFNAIYIDCDGSLLACGDDINNQIFIADLKKMSLKDAWYCDNMKSLRKAHIDANLTGTVCENCLVMGGGEVVEVLNI